MNNPLLILSLMFVICSAEAGAQICFKTAVKRLGRPSSSLKEMVSLGGRMLLSPRVWFGLGLCYVVLALWLVVLSYSDLNFAFSLSSLHYIFIALVSQFVLKEKISARQWAATWLVSIGVFIVSLTGG